MKNKTLLVIVVALLLSSFAFAQEQTEGEGRGRVEFGVRQVWGDVYGRPDIPFRPTFTSSKYNEYRDVRNGLFVKNFNLSLDDVLGARNFLNLQARNTLLKDQAYLATFGSLGSYKAQFRYDQSPHIFSNTARTLYSQPTPGVFRLSNIVRSSLQGTASAGIPAAINGLLPTASLIDTSLRRDTAAGNVVYTPTEDLSIAFQYSREKQHGARPIGAHMFASPSNTTLELPEVIDYRTHEVKAGTEYGKKSWVTQFNYLGSFFENKVGELVWDNPFRLTSLSDASATGRMDLYPNNSAQSVNFAGAADLGKYVRVMSSVTPGWMRQNDKFVAGTANTAIAGMQPMPADSLNGNVQTLAMNYTATSRPFKNFEITARYRHYDYNNNTKILQVSTVQADSASSDHGPVVHDSRILSFFKKTAEVTGTYYITNKNLVKVGYEYEGFDREHRDVKHSAENSVIAALDLNPLKQINLRLAYRHSDRTPDLYEDEDPAQLVAARRFDEAARIRDRAEASLQFTPVDALTFGASYGTTQDDYNQPDANAPVVYGLLKDIGYNYTFDVNYAPVSQLAFFGEYTREKYKTRMRSRQRGFPTTTAGNDLANNDWMSASNDLTDTYAAGFDVYLSKGKVTLTSFYSLSAAQGQTLSRIVGDKTVSGFLVTAISDYPETTNRLHQLVSSVKFRLAKNLYPKFEYRLDQYDVKDYQSGIMNPYMFPANLAGRIPFAGDSGARQILFLGADAPSYRGHAVSASIEYHF